MKKRMTMVAGLIFCVAQSPVLANRITVHVENCNSYHGAKVCIYDGRDNDLPLAPRSTKVAEKGEQITAKCKGEGKGRCYITVIDRGQGCVMGTERYAIDRNDTIYVHRHSKWTLSGYGSACPGHFH